ncbi:MAG TPA: UDP-N-acetylmuramate--L-alanine ligase [Candidatus Paceibacterota bacterium]|nr:UDP-N-acetylmuramate--L-alanine ligase [Candidatus Paceibacterota bacterium]
MNINYKKIHFIGIGGIGMSALARLFKSFCLEVSGSDSSNSEITKDLSSEDIKISIGHNAKNISADTECIVYTLAISQDNPEFLEAKKRKIPMYTYAQMLGYVSAGMYTIAISGTHGKTTTTAMTYYALKESGIKPNLIVGSLIFENNKKTNFVSGKDNFFVVEACEYKKSFLNLSPTILAITNIEADHLDFYKDLEDVKSAFMQMADLVPEEGAIICDFEDKNVKEIIEKHGIFKKDLNLSVNKNKTDTENSEINGKCINFRDYIKDVPELFVIGDHNIRNASISLAVAYFLNFKFSQKIESDFYLNYEKAKTGLQNFRGTWRRMEFRGKNQNGAIIYDDYGHHPTEIRATLLALTQKFPDKNLKVFFQPHLYSRTKNLFDDFVKVFNEFFGENSVIKNSQESVRKNKKNKLFILPIYAAREENDPEISAEKLADEIFGAVALKDFSQAKEEIFKADSSDVVLSLGAGDVYQILE